MEWNQLMELANRYEEMIIFIKTDSFHIHQKIIIRFSPRIMFTFTPTQHFDI